MTQQRLLLISPVHNEAAYLELVAEAVARQQRRPDLWVIVDDGSTDETPQILERLARRFDFVRVVHAIKPPSRGGGKDKLAVAADAASFNIGLHSVAWETFTHIAKLDGDTELEPDYFERVLAEFERDPELGLAGGIYADPDPSGDGNGWKVMFIPSEYHVPGTLKCYSLSCFQAIGGIQERLAWDTIDEAYARMLGFRTRSFPELVVRHHRPSGSADGVLRGRARHGQCAYIARFTLSWVTLRALKVAGRDRPRGISGLAFLYGYLSSAVRRAPRVEDPEFRVFVRGELRERMRAELGGRAVGARSLVPASGRGS
jgi:biofilm PGA synthesis N-glycosyltransferase PgaC